MEGGLGGGVCSLANYRVTYEETQSNQVSDFRNFVLFFISKGNPFLLLSITFLVTGFIFDLWCFSVLLVLRLPRLGKRELILVLFVRLFGLYLFRFVGFLLLLGFGKGCGL